jgi:hypothetical protein
VLAEFADWHLSSVGLAVAAQGGKLLDRVFDYKTGVAGEPLNPAYQFFLPAFKGTEIILRQTDTLVVQTANGDIPIAFDFGHVHICLFFGLWQRKL